MSKTKCKMSILAAKAKRETGLVAIVLVPTDKASWVSRRIMAFWGDLGLSDMWPVGLLKALE